MTTKINNTHELILDFIKQFRDLGAEECFSYGMCYWFAKILNSRFNGEFENAIVYDEVANHFGCLINERVYDITGDVTDKYQWSYWSIYTAKDPALYRRLMRDCVFKVPNNVKICGLCAEAYDDEHGNLICHINNSPKFFNELCSVIMQ